MAANTTIEWATKSWNPVRGCSRVSPGCDHCYAMNFAHRFSGAGKPYEGLTTIRKGKVDWSGIARFIPGELDAPLRWRKPERIFVNSMSDLFHHSLSNEEIAAVFGVMAAAPRHQFLVLTKRPERALGFFRWLEGSVGTNLTTGERVAMRTSPLAGIEICAGRHVRLAPRTIRTGEPGPTWPLPNVWLGVSCENQQTADERIPVLLKCPAAVRWISAEPLLGPLALGRYLPEVGIYGPALDWVVVGGESGNGARPFGVSWANAIVEQCREAAVACFVKQLGKLPIVVADPTGCEHELTLKNKKGNDPSEWPAALRVREFPRSA